VVFDNLPLEKFGNRLPQLNFEIFRRVIPDAAGGLEDMVRAITVISGAAERVYDTKIQKRNAGCGAKLKRRSS
jgi:hypothetical protein